MAKLMNYLIKIIGLIDCEFPVWTDVIVLFYVFRKGTFNESYNSV